MHECANVGHCQLYLQVDGVDLTLLACWSDVPGDDQYLTVSVVVACAPVVRSVRVIT